MKRRARDGKGSWHFQAKLAQRRGKLEICSGGRRPRGRELEMGGEQV